MNQAAPVQDSFEVHGMTCAACVARVERSIAKLPGVKSVAVNLATESATVVYDGSEVTPDKVVSVIEQTGYEGKWIDSSATHANPTERASEKEERQRGHTDELWQAFIQSCYFTVPLFLVAMVPMLWEPIMAAMMQWLSMEQWNYVMLLLCIPVQFWFGARFYRLGWKSLTQLSPDMNSLVMIGTTAAFAYSLVVTLWPSAVPADSRHVYYESAAVVITLVLLGKYLEMRSRGEAGRAMRGLMKLQPLRARVEREGQQIEVPLESVVLHETVQVLPGETIPLDGTILHGSTFVDESMVTGESIPVSKDVGDKVIGGTINQNGSVQFRVDSVGSESTLARIIDFVEKAQASKPAIQSVADRVVAYFVPVVLLIALVCGIGWYVATGRIEPALIHAVSILIVACPCAMGLAVPTSIMVGTGKGAQHGVLFRESNAIEELASSAVVAVDKTGTITAGKPSVTSVHVAEGFNSDEVIRLVLNVQRKSEHPIAKAIVEKYKNTSPGPMPFIMNFNAVPGYGIEASLGDGRLIHVGSEKYMARLEIPLTAMASIVAEKKSEGASLFYVAVNRSIAGLFALEDALKPDSKKAVEALRNENKEVMILSGDQQTAVARVAEQLDLPPGSSLGELVPQEKAEKVEELRRSKGSIVFVGDGLNDAPALVAANAGVAIGTGTDLAMESADVVLMSGEISGLVRAIDLSKAIMTNIRQNLGWAFGYNILLIPLASGVLEPLLGWTFSPVHAAMAMSLSSFFVVTNALRLRAWTPREI